MRVAKALGITGRHVSGIVDGHVRITANMAIRQAAAFHTEAQLWGNLQARYDFGVRLRIYLSQ
jgi:addiction module HigA family antidote